MYTYKYPHPALTADSVVFGFDGRALYVLLIERGIQPYKGSWALPGGFMNIDESIEECARRELMEETGINNVYLEQFGVYSTVDRDPRERVVTVAFFALVPKGEFKVVAGDDAAGAMWFEFDELPPLAFDHHRIIKDARAHIAEVMRLRPIAFKLLDKYFSLSELQRLYELITGATYDRRNFYKKMSSTGFLHASAEPEEEFPLPSECRSLSRPADHDLSDLAVQKVVPQSRRPNLYSFDEEAFEEKQSKSRKGRNPFWL